MHYGRTLPQDFLDAETTDFYNWRINSWYSQTSVVGTTGKIYWMEAYSFNEAEIVKALRRTINGDTKAPYYHSPSPTPNATGVNVNTNIAVNLKEDGSGVDRASVKMAVTVPDDAAVSGKLTLTGNFLDFRLEFDPTSPLPAETRVTVKVDGKDLFNNVMPTYEWHFNTGTVTVEPTSFGKAKATFH